MANESALVAYIFTEGLNEADGMAALKLSVPLPFPVYADEEAVRNLKSVWNRAAMPAEEGEEAGDE